LTQITQFDICPLKGQKDVNPWGPGYHTTFQCVGKKTKPFSVEYDMFVTNGNIHLTSKPLPAEARCNQ